MCLLKTSFFSNTSAERGSVYGPCWAAHCSGQDKDHFPVCALCVSLVQRFGLCASAPERHGGEEEEIFRNSNHWFKLDPADGREVKHLSKCFSVSLTRCSACCITKAVLVGTAFQRGKKLLPTPQLGTSIHCRSGLYSFVPFTCLEKTTAANLGISAEQKTSPLWPLFLLVPHVCLI